MTEPSTLLSPGSSNAIELASLYDSKITNVSLYDERAEVTRLYTLHVKTGQNQITINGLPDVLDRDSLRVEGRGAATIHDVALLDMSPPPVQNTSIVLDDLLTRRELCELNLYRCKKSTKALEGYLVSLNVQHIDAMQVGKVIENYNLTAQKIDEKVVELGASIKAINREITSERDKLAALGQADLGLRMQALISVFTEAEGDVELILTYAVYNARWSACYDIRADMQANDTPPVTLAYKATITQSTGEAWDNVPLTLETAAPTFGVNIPKLSHWALSVYKPPTITVSRRLSPRFLDLEAEVEEDEEDKLQEEAEEENAIEEDYGDLELKGRERAMNRLTSSVSSRGNVSATYNVPGVITIPSDGAAHNVTVAQLNLDATMSWVAVPKVDARAHLKATIRNDSEYTLLPGSASVYVAGSFISRSTIPLVSPQESFDQPLGLDPSIRVIYHPLVKKVSETGFYTKADKYVYSQRITVLNTKANQIDNVKIMDQVPVSEDARITIKLLNPSLTVPENASREGGAPPPVRVSDGVIAQWEGADEGFDMASLGRDGKFNWICSVPAKGKINLLLSWEVSAPVRTHIVGL